MLLQSEPFHYRAARAHISCWVLLSHDQVHLQIRNYKVQKFELVEPS